MTISTLVLPLKLVIILYNEITICSHGFMGTTKLFKGLIFLTWNLYITGLLVGYPEEIRLRETKSEGAAIEIEDYIFV
jgi:hypothetical protein